MSLGYCGLCRKDDEDEELVIYTYSGENWNDKNSKSGDIELQDGVFVIYKRCLEEAEIHECNIRMPSGRKKLIQKRITHVPSINTYIESGNIIIEKECKNAFKRGKTVDTDYIAYRLLFHVFERYQKEGKLPDSEMFIQ